MNMYNGGPQPAYPVNQLTGAMQTGGPMPAYPGNGYGNPYMMPPMQTGGNQPAYPYHPMFTGGQMPTMQINPIMQHPYNRLLGGMGSYGGQLPGFNQRYMVR